MWSLHAVVTWGARISTLAVTLFLIQENWSLGGAAITFIGVGILDRGAELPPEVHYFTRSRHPWVILPPEVPAFAERGDPGKPAAAARIAAALARAPASFQAWAQGS
jgi:hypothetical protein